jgi:hypothetical protein
LTAALRLLGLNAAYAPSKVRRCRQSQTFFQGIYQRESPEETDDFDSTNKKGRPPYSIGGLIGGRPLDRRSASLETTPRPAKVSGDFGDQKARRAALGQAATPVSARGLAAATAVAVATTETADAAADDDAHATDTILPARSIVVATSRATHRLWPAVVVI